MSSWYFGELERRLSTTSAAGLTVQRLQIRSATQNISAFLGKEGSEPHTPGGAKPFTGKRIAEDENGDEKMAKKAKQEPGDAAHGDGTSLILSSAVQSHCCSI